MENSPYAEQFVDHQNSKAQTTLQPSDALIKTRKLLFVKIPSVDIAFQFAQRMLTNKCPVKVRNESEGMPNNMQIMPYDIIEIDTARSANSVMTYIIQNDGDWSDITVLVPG